METTTPNLGQALKKRRKQLGLNLVQLAERSGVSRSMLSEIERGNANPTFTTLWNITRALGVSIDELAQSASPRELAFIEQLSGNQTPRMVSDDGGCELRALNPLATAAEVEWYELRIKPGAALHSEAHARGTIEHLSVLEGELLVRLNEQLESRVLAEGTLRYPADVRHSIINSGGELVRALLVVQSG